MFNALMDPMQLGQSVQNAFMLGQQQRRQYETDKALAGYAQNMSPETAANVARYDPQAGIKLQQFEMQRQEEAAKVEQQRRAADLQRRAAAGDQAALAELAGIDLDAWSKLDGRTKQDAKERFDFIGNAALAVSRLPEANRAAAWDAYVMQGVQMGMPELQQYVGQYSPDSLNAVIAHAGLVKTFIDMNEPRYTVVPAEAQLVNTRDPNVIAGFTGQGGMQAGGPMIGRTGATSDPVPNIPTAAINYLLTHPETAQMFNEKYGEGAAQKALGVWK